MQNEKKGNVKNSGNKKIGKKLNFFLTSLRNTNSRKSIFDFGKCYVEKPIQ